MISFGIISFTLSAGINLVLKIILLTTLKLDSSSKIALNFETEILFLFFSSIIETLFFHRFKRVTF